MNGAKREAQRSRTRRPLGNYRPSDATCLRRYSTVTLLPKF